jgi:DNA-binding MarR family transcriptional regulator
MPKEPLTEQRDESVFSVCNNSAIRRAARRMGQIYDDALAPCGLKATQYSLLSQIKRGEGPTMRFLADRMVMDLSALGHTLKPLMRDGFVALLADEKDRRSRRVYLTKLGEEKLREGQQLWKLVHGNFDRIFGKEKAASLRETLDLVASGDFADQLTNAMH